MLLDTHYYLTYALLKQVFDERTTETTCILCGMVDDLVRYPDKDYALFHFIHDSTTQVCYSDSPISQWLLAEAYKRDIRLFGIFLHTWQDTFSHHKFSGYEWEGNSVYPWWNPISIIPNIGHAEVGILPDIATKIWEDKRQETNRMVDNKERVALMCLSLRRIIYQLTGKTLKAVEVCADFCETSSQQEREQKMIALYSIPEYNPIEIPEDLIQEAKELARYAARI